MDRLKLGNKIEIMEVIDILKSETDPQMIDKKKPRSGESLGFEKKDVLLTSLRVDRVSFDRINSCIMPISST